MRRLTQDLFDLEISHWYVRLGLWIDFKSIVGPMPFPTNNQYFTDLTQGDRIPMRNKFLLPKDST